MGLFKSFVLFTLPNPNFAALKPDAILLSVIAASAIFILVIALSLILMVVMALLLMVGAMAVPDKSPAS